MRNLFAFLLICLFITINTLSAQQINDTTAKQNVEKKEAIVYVTKIGSKYHSSNCGYLHSSKIAMTLKDAKQNYSACSGCKGSSNYTPKTTKSTYQNTSTAVQCSGTTKAGNRCKRRTTYANGRCYQH